MNSLQNLIQRLSAIGQVNEEAEEKCSECGCTPCECDDKEKVEEGKKPDFLDADNDGNKKETMSDALKDKEEEVKESSLDLLRRHAGIQEAAPVNFDKVLDAIAALYGDDMWNNDSMQDLAHDLEQQNPTEQELDSIIATGELPQRLANTQFTNNDSVKFGEGAMDKLKQLGKQAFDKLGGGNEEDLIKDLQKKAGVPQTGKKPSEEEVKETALNLLRRYAGIQETKIEEDDVEEGNEFSGALKAAKDSGKEEFEVAGKKYKVNECGEDYPSSGQMSPMTMTGQEQPHMGIPAEVMAQMAGQEQGPEIAQPEMAVPEAPKATYTLNISNGDNNLSMTTDVPDEIIHIMKLAGVNQGAEVTKKEMPADGEQEVEESGYENTPDNTKARDPQAHGDIRDWGQKGTANAKTHYTPAQSGDNPMNEQRMFDDYKNFKAGK